MRFAALAMALALGGCVAYVPADVVLLSTPDTFKVQWDEFRATEKDEQTKAEAHCGGRGIELVDAGQDPSAQYKWRTWKCVGAVQPR